MPLIQKKVNVETEMLNARISKELYTRLGRYCAFSGRTWEERHEVIEVLLKYALDHDTDFKKESGAAPDAPGEVSKPARRSKEKAETAA